MNLARTRLALPRSVMVHARKPIVKQAGRFAITTGLSAMLSLGLPILLVEQFGFSEHRAVQIAFVTAYLINLLATRHFVFKSTNHWRRDLVAYVFANGAFRGAEYAAFALAMLVVNAPYYVIIFCVLAVSAVTKFFVYRWIFK